MRHLYLFSQEAMNRERRKGQKVMQPMMMRMMNGTGIATRYAVELKTNLRILRVTWSLDLPMTMNPPF
jgi:hypothetical protein